MADTLSPVVLGGVYETAPFDGVPDATETIPFINASNISRDRAVFEFDLTDIPLGTVESASLTGRVAANNSFNTGTRVHNIDAYSGDGAITLGDYNIAGIPIGSFSHPSGGSTNFELNVAAALQSLLDGGAANFGVRISAGNDPQFADVIDESVPLTLSFSVSPANTTLQNLFTAVDAQGDHPSGGLASVSDGDNSFVIRRNATSSTDRRTIMEFDLRSIPVNASIVSATINAQIFSFTQSPGQNPQPLFYGYAGNGTATPADLEQTSNLIGTADPITATGSFRVDLDPEYIESLLGASDYLGLLGVGNPNGQSVQFWTWEARSFATPPYLSLIYAVPPVAGDYNRNGSVGADDFALWKNTYGATTGDMRADGNYDGVVNAADYTVWRNHLSSAGTAALAAEVPEPSTLGLLSVANIALAWALMGRFCRTILPAP